MGNLTGYLYFSLLSFYIAKPEYVNPCLPSPCGPYSECREVNNHAVCSCQKNYIGTPPSCRPECMVSSECAQNKACINQKCVDPCPGTCGQNARCQTVNHNPICSCATGYTGDPFVRCLPERKDYLLSLFTCTVSIRLFFFCIPVYYIYACFAQFTSIHCQFSNKCMISFTSSRTTYHRKTKREPMRSFTLRSSFGMSRHK